MFVVREFAVPALVRKMVQLLEVCLQSLLSKHVINHDPNAQS